MQPKLAILITVVLALNYCAAAPNAYSDNMLPRPSPINPDIPMDPKPAETITLITDPKEIAKFKREIAVESTTLHFTAPTTVLPTHPPHPLYQPEQTDDHNERLQHHRQKRDSKTSEIHQKRIQDKPTGKSNVPSNDKQTAAVSSSTPAPSKRNRPTSTSSTLAPAKKTTSLTPEKKHRQKRDDKDGTVPLIYRDQHKQPVLPLAHQVPSNHAQHELTSNPLIEHQSTIRSETTEQPHKETKRDIPVPLVPKYHHPEETPEAEDQQDSKSISSKEADNTSTNKPPEHATSTTTTQQSTESSLEKKPEKRTPAESPDVVQVEDLSENHQQHPTKQPHQQQTTSSIFRPRPVPVAELFAKGKSAETPEKDHHEAN